jgi:DsbC/DsbD-like thiol-disulfide interchange protein
MGWPDMGWPIGGGHGGLPVRRRHKGWAVPMGWTLLIGWTLAATAMAPLSGATAAEGAASDWSNGYNSRVRLVGGIDRAAGGRGLVAGVEIETKPDWKTYWRNPGDAGVPPTFDWSGSENVAAVEVLYPAPRRFVDKAGTTIGYLGQVTFPVAVTPKDPAQPVTLRLAIDYGVCKEICVPAQAELTLGVSPSATMPRALSDAVGRVPRPRGREAAGDPVIEAVAVELAATPPRIVLEARVPGGADSADAFLVGEDGAFVPLAVRAPGARTGYARFVVDLSRDFDIKDFKGKSIFAVVVGAGGASEARIRVDAQRGSSELADSP